MIIRLFAGAALVIVLAAAAGLAAQEPAAGSGTACLSCVILQVPAAAAASLDMNQDALSGITAVVDASEPAAARALERLAAAGAQPGILTGPAETPSSGLLDVVSQGPLLIVRALAGDDASVFAARTLATTARSTRPDARVLVLGDIPERARAYVDGRVEPGPALAAPDARTLVALSQQGGADPVLVVLTEVDWRAVAGFAAARAVSTQVVAAGALTAEQIVARHQAVRRRQDQLVRRTIARGHSSVMFEVPGFVAPVTITAETVVYRQPGASELEQRDIRVNGAAVAGGSATSPPQLPLIEPDRVATPPLAITLDEAYRYALDGRERTRHGEAFVVTFEPRRGGDGAAHGRAWIDAATFALVRLEIVQTGLKGAIVSSEQQDVFEPFALGRDTVWLPVETRAYQMYEGAGHRTPIHRVISTPGYDINPEDFDSRLRAAYASPHLMLRETPQGFRYLLRADDAPESSVREVAPRAGERIRTAVFGLLVDPNITTPLPYAGLSYVDLNLFNTGAQVNLFFGGTYGQFSWSVPSLAGTDWRAHGRAFGITARYNDRSFRGGVEQYAENITQRPAHVSAGVVRPLTRRARARFDYELDYTAFDRADTTAPTFAIPADAIVHGFVAALEMESGPWTLRGWWNLARRQGWREWGSAHAPADATRAFQRLGIAAARTIALGGIVTSRVEAAWMDGRDLDRFSRYSFGAFDNRLRGYPTASIRYDRGGVLRTVTSWAGRGFRVDAFGDVAAVRDPGFGDVLRAYPGIGAAVEAGGPLRTLWSVEWGYGFRAHRSDGGLGTQALRVTGYRSF